MNNILIWSIKGGCGKSLISKNIAKDLDVYYTTNDKFGSQFWNTYKKYIDYETLDFNNNDKRLIIDMGGHIPESKSKKIHFINAILSSNSLIIPHFFNEEVEAAVKTYEIIKGLDIEDKNIIFIVKTKSKNQREQFEKYKRFLKSKGILTENIYMLHHSEMFANNKKMTIIERIENLLNKNSNFNNDYQKILEMIKVA